MVHFVYIIHDQYSRDKEYIVSIWTTKTMVLSP